MTPSQPSQSDGKRSLAVGRPVMWGGRRGDYQIGGLLDQRISGMKSDLAKLRRRIAMHLIGGA